ncbi:HAD family hydrolase [Raoultibacter phocaeensis]|uniref:HAD family hydrolase n=1 Tax=Raoultibacter phocaeensis TaxID=2479841 RepID=UPI00111B3224|nr:HAD family hydrolase [Raoultibacter phocaeensis]
MQRRFDTFIFDLDGTLLDTLPDLVALTNRALADSGFPARTEDEILSFVGNGVRALMDQAVPLGTEPAAAEAAMQLWRELYPACGIELTVAYDGIAELLAELKARGKKLAVLSNKFDQGVRDLIPLFFPDTFDVVHGECKDIPRKPDPAGLLHTIEELGANPETTAYVGDSGSDMLTGHRAGVFAIGVSWGYRSVDELQQNGALAIVHEPAEILAFA